MVRSKKEVAALANLLKTTHKSLQAESLNKSETEVREIWLKHTQNTELLQKYATAMRTLSMEHWDDNKDYSRIYRMYYSLKGYFFGDGLKVRLEKEKRRVQILEPTSLNSFLQKASSVEKRYKSLEKIKVLDVGSCFNPFGKFDELDVIPIDLHPATPDVYKCDFLRLKVTDKDDTSCEISDLSQEDSKSEKGQENMKTFIQKIKRLISLFSFSRTFCGVSSENTKHFEIRELKEESFDVVMLSLVLSYLPTPKLRYECVLKAFKLLKPCGVLCIVTTRTTFSSLFRLWACVFAFIGYERISYFKFDNSFCGMIFRKTLVPSTLKKDAEVELMKLKTKEFPYLNWDSIHNSVYMSQELRLSSESSE